jgi:four helix bundle protein
MSDYTSLRAWQQAHALAHATFDLIEAHWSGPLGSTFEQLRRAALSVPLNIAEGHAMGPGGRCRYHLRIAYGSAVETEAVLRFLGERTIPTAPLLPMVAATRALTYRLWQRSRPEE